MNVPSMPVFRVRFSDGLEPPPQDALVAAGARWEGSEDSPEMSHHRILVGASTEDEAIGIVREALRSHGSFRDFDAEPVRDRRGEITRTLIRSWEDIDWEQVQRKSGLSEFQRLVLGTLGNAAEPTWIIVHDPDVLGDRDSGEAALRDLEQRNIVHSTWEESGEPGHESAMAQWWAITDEGWDLLGLIKSPRYR
jgi:hypothetical protein